MYRDLDASNCIEVSDACLRALAADLWQEEFDAEEDELAWEALQVQDLPQPRLVGKARMHVEAHRCVCIESTPNQFQEQCG